MAKNNLEFSTIVTRGPVTCTKQEQMQAATYGKYRIIRDLTQSLETARQFADQNFNEILQMKDEQGEAFNTDSYDYKCKKEGYLEYSYQVDLYENLIQWVYEA